MKIAVLGTRGFPGVQGGIEEHCEKLYPRLANLGCDITVFTRKPYVDPEIKNYKNIDLAAIDCPKVKGVEAVVHTFKGVFRVRGIRPDILHIHAIGPSLFIPLARLLGLKVVMTNHGADYRRKKWAMPGKILLKLGEIFAGYCANEMICISDIIGGEIKSQYKRDVHVIPNGFEMPEILETKDTLKKYSLVSSRYILAVGRFVPEKGFDDLVDAFGRIHQHDWKLVIVGSADHEGRFSRRLKKKAGRRSNVVLTGVLKGKPLGELYSHAGLFVLPSYYEGLPLVLFEAMSYGLSCLASDIPGNRYASLPEENYFKAGDIRQLSNKIWMHISDPLSFGQRVHQVEKFKHDHNWDEIALKTLEVYRKAIGEEQEHRSTGKSTVHSPQNN